MKRLVTGTIAVASLLLLTATTSLADPPIQELSVQLNNISKSGSYSITFSSRETDPNGGVADPVDTAQIRFPSGVKIRKQFLTKKHLCDLAKLKLSKNPDMCKNAAIGKGTATADLRQIIPNTIIDANLTLFLAKGPSGSVAEIVILAQPISDDPFIKNSKQILEIPIFNDPSADGRYGYRLELDAAIETGLPNANISVPKVITTVTGMSLKERKNGKIKKIFWLTQPSCNQSQIRFQTTFNYKTSPPITKEVELPCFKLPGS